MKNITLERVQKMLARTKGVKKARTRHPAGAPGGKGGEFAPKDGGAGGAGGASAAAESPSTPDVSAVKLRNEMSKLGVIPIKNPGYGGYSKYQDRQLVRGRVNLGRDTARLLTHLKDEKNGWSYKGTPTGHTFTRGKNAVHIYFNEAGTSRGHMFVEMEGPKKAKPLTRPYYD